MTFLDRFNYARRHDGDRESGKSGASSTGAVSAAPTGAEGALAASGAEGAGTRTSEYIGWRSWSLKGDRLRSVNVSCVWEGPVMHADQVPTRNNAHGIYAVTNLEAAPYTDVWGEVALSGIVVVGENGYRAQTVTIRSLYLGRDFRPVVNDGICVGMFEFFPSDALVRALEERYQVQVQVEPETRMARYYREHPGYGQQFNPALNAINALQHAMQQSTSHISSVWPSSFPR